MQCGGVSQSLSYDAKPNREIANAKRIGAVRWNNTWAAKATKGTIKRHSNSMSNLSHYSFYLGIPLCPIPLFFESI